MPLTRNTSFHRLGAHSSTSSSPLSSSARCGCRSLLFAPMVKLNTLQLPSKRLVLSYIIDWFVILYGSLHFVLLVGVPVPRAIAGVGGGVHYADPYYRPFSVIDLGISFPHQRNETVPPWLLVVLAMIIPGVTIFVVCLILLPGPTADKNTPKLLIWRRKFWEWNTGWMGLGLSLASAFFITESLKNLFGKPRPDMLSRCNPSLDRLNDPNIVVGGYGQDISNRWVLVTREICLQTDRQFLNDGFRSFPSGHSSFGWAGLLYLSLFLCSKFSIGIPFLHPTQYTQNPQYTAHEKKQVSTLPRFRSRSPPRSLGEIVIPRSLSSSTAGNDEREGRPRRERGTPSSSVVVPLRNRAAAPPIPHLVLAFIPVAVAAWISTTRYTDFRHRGIDIFVGIIIGSCTAWGAFRWYHLPIRRGAGWSWGARSRKRAFGIGVGEGNYVGTEGWGERAVEEGRSEEPLER
ncbi:PAP2 superfamily-domain-containing protein [Lineolata rhizophorae]|uniref:PAP2 superfamily-domain-containing protein n=1 Tax=Lineolata rhizophorae TaxID=578093 RepID=A0A6A6PAX8_9PEZI|nr:PAP2 superfamily-domain-containing protein [Lineolata rhizophorae]